MCLHQHREAAGVMPIFVREYFRVGFSSYIASERDCIVVKSNQTAVETLLGSSASALLRGKRLCSDLGVQFDDNDHRFLRHSPGSVTSPLPVPHVKRLVVLQQLQQ